MYNKDLTPRKILALDGGGVRGILSLWMLRGWEERHGRRACDSFDMFAGTSTGAIIAALLAYARLSAADVLDLYDDMVDRVFAPSFSSTAVGRLFARRIYARESALARLEEVFGDRTLAEVEVRSDGGRPAVLLTTHDLVRNEELFLSSYPFKSGKLNYGRTWKIRDAVTASALSAPWYFGPYEGRFVDGGLTVFNTPARQAALEALDYCGDPLFEPGATSLWSFGTGAFDASFAAGEGDDWRPWRWAERLFRDIHGDAEADQIYGAERLARKGEFEFRRYQITIAPETLAELKMPAEGVRLPIALDRADAREFLHEVGRRFAARIDWDSPSGFRMRPPHADPFADPGLWRAADPPPPQPARAAPGRRLE